MTSQNTNSTSRLLNADKDTRLEIGYNSTAGAGKRTSGTGVLSSHFGSIAVQKNSRRLISCCVFFFFTSLSITLFSRHLYGYGFPIFFSLWLQSLLALILSAVLGTQVSFWPRFSWNLKTAVQLLPVGVLFVLRVLFTCLALDKTQVSTYNVTRAQSILFSVVLSVIFLKMRPSFLEVFSCVIAATSVVFVVFDPEAIGVVGLVFGIIGSLSVAFYLVVVKRYLPLVDNQHLILLNYNSVASSILFIPMIYMFGDLEKLKRFLPWMAESEGEPLIKIWTVLAFALLSGFLINVSTMLVLKATSPVTHDIINTLKGATQAVYGAVIMNDSLSFANVTGVILSLVGSLLYTIARQLALPKETKTKKNITQP